MRSIISLITLFVLLAPTSQAQPKIQKNWKAVWITTPDTHVKDYGVYEFRKSFKLDRKSL